MPKIGDALKRAVETRPEEVEDRSRSRPASVLMNPSRRQIFQALCSRPCSGMKALAAQLSMSRSSLSWHMEQLIAAEYVTAHEHRGKPVYCPTGMISQANMPTFAVLADSGCREVHDALLAAPGSDRGMLASAAGMHPRKVDACVKELVGTGLATQMRDGRHTRYFSTDRLQRMMSEEKRVQKEFVRSLIRRLASEHLRPDVTELKGVGIVITMNILGRSEKLEIPFRVKD